MGNLRVSLNVTTAVIVSDTRTSQPSLSMGSSHIQRCSDGPDPLIQLSVGYGIHGGSQNRFPVDIEGQL